VDALKCGGTGLLKLVSEPSAAKVTLEVLTKRHLDIVLVVSTTRMKDSVPNVAAWRRHQNQPVAGLTLVLQQ
jgi:hypothetical protein